MIQNKRKIHQDDKIKRLGVAKKKKATPPNIKIYTHEEFIKDTDINSKVAVFITEDGISLYTNNKYYYSTNSAILNQPSRYIVYNITNTKIVDIKVYRDILIGANIIDENQDNTNFNSMCKHYLDTDAYKTQNVEDKYNVLNAKYIYDIYEKQEPLIQDQMDIYEFELELIPIIFDLQYTGISVNTSKLKELEDKYNNTILDLKERFKTLIKEHKEDIDKYNLLNPDKPFNYDIEDVGIYLYKILKYPDKKSVSTETIMSIDKEIGNIVGKYRSNIIYLNNIQNIYNSLGEDNRCHTHFNFWGAKTGRISCGDPINLQSMPKNELRNVFEGGTVYRDIDKRKDNSYVVNKCDEVQLSNENWVFADELQEGDILITGETVKKIIEKDYKVLIGLCK